MSETAEKVDVNAPVSGDVRAYVVSDGGSSLWTPLLDDAVSELGYAADNEGLLFDRETATQALAELAPGDKPFRFADWSVEVQMVDKGWLESLPEFDGW